MNHLGSKPHLKCMNQNKSNQMYCIARYLSMLGYFKITPNLFVYLKVSHRFHETTTSRSLSTWDSSPMELHTLCDQSTRFICKHMISSPKGGITSYTASRDTMISTYSCRYLVTSIIFPFHFLANVWILNHFLVRLETCLMLLKSCSSIIVGDLHCSFTTGGWLLGMTLILVVTWHSWSNYRLCFETLRTHESLIGWW
jgi:hypothetical protein